MNCLATVRGYVLAGLFCAVGSWICADEVDCWSKPDDTTRATLKGKVTDDLLYGVKVMVGEAEKKIPRGALYGVYYEEANIELQRKAEAAYAAGDYREAEKIFGQVAKAAEGMAPDRKALLMQHVYYYAGMCNLKMGKYEQAESMLRNALSKKDSSWYFEAELARAECKEAQRDFAGAADAYALLAKNEFTKHEASPAAKVVPKYLYIANQAAVRCGLKDTTRNPGNESKVNDLLQRQEDLIKGNAAVVEESPDLMAEALANKARGFKYLKKYKELIDILDRPVRAAQDKNNRTALAGLYLDRADAYYGMMEQAKGEEQKSLREIARFEYLRVVLGYELGGEDDAKAAYRLGKLFADIRDKDWQVRATRFLRKASSDKNGGQFARDAGDLLKTVQEAK